MARYERFEQMPIWKLSQDIAVKAYRMTNTSAFARDHSFRSQIRRAAVSISSNIAEGFERRTKKEFARYLYIAKASAGEVRSHLAIALRLEYITEPDCLAMTAALESVAKQISAFIQQLQGKR